MQEQQQYLGKFLKMIKDVRICMMISNENEGEHLSGRPMAINKVDDDGTIWFFSKKSSQQTTELDHQKNVSLAIVNEGDNNYLMVNGTADLVNDKEMMKELWSSKMKAWFPLGLEDPDMTLIKVSPEEVNYWDSNSSSMIVLFSMIKAIVTGKEYSEGEHGTINL